MISCMLRNRCVYTLKALNKWRSTTPERRAGLEQDEKNRGKNTSLGEQTYIIVINLHCLNLVEQKHYISFVNIFQCQKIRKM